MSTCLHQFLNCRPSFSVFSCGNLCKESRRTKTFDVYIDMNHPRTLCMLQGDGPRAYEGLCRLSSTSKSEVPDTHQIDCEEDFPEEDM